MQIGEDADYMLEIHKAKQENRKPYMRIVPVNFNSEHKAMLGHCRMILKQMVEEKCY
ncbi:MAG: hypothetical protein ACJ71F_18290 [Nitrososphaeraceae archaeon]